MADKAYCSELEDSDDINSPEDDEWAARIRDGKHLEQKEMLMVRFKVKGAEAVTKRLEAVANGLPTITIDNVENDDWMKTLPGYKDEARIIAELRDNKQLVPVNVIKPKKVVVKKL